MEVRERKTDQVLINRVTDNIYFRFLHQATTVIALPVLAYFLHMAQGYMEKIDRIEVILSGITAGYTQQFGAVDQRLTRLENQTDDRYIRRGSP